MALVLLILLQLNNPTRELIRIDNSGHILVAASPSLVAHEIYRQVLSNFNKFPRPVCNGDVIWQVAIADSNQELGYRILAPVYILLVRSTPHPRAWFGRILLLKGGTNVQVLFPVDTARDNWRRMRAIEKQARCAAIVE